MVTRTTILRLGQCATALLLVFGAAAPAAAQSFTIGGAASQTSQPGADFATTVLGDPWDFTERTDWVHMYSDNGSGPSAFTGTPTQTNGVLRGVSSGSAPSIQVLYQGIEGALNAIGRSGVTTPIDSSRYRRLSFRVRRSSTPGAQDRIGAFWFPNSSMAGSGFALWQAHGVYAGYQHANMMPVAAQTAPTYQIYRVDLDAPLQSSGVAWTGMVRGLKVRVAWGATVQNATIDLDWIRLTERGNAAAIRRLQWSGLGGRVVLRATHAPSGDVIQIYPEGTSGAVDFADNSFLDWDYGYLPPGTWTITAQGSNASRTVTLNIDAAPVMSVLEPDAEGGRDFATTVIGDAWDLTNPQDVQRNNASLHHLTSASFDENGLLGTTRGGSYASGCAADSCPDPYVQFLDDGFGAGPPIIDANTYHRLSFTLDYDHHELMIGEALSDTWGGVARVAWARSDSTGYTPYTITQDIVVLDGGPVRYSMDLASFVNNTTLEDPIAGLWTGQIGTFRIDINESEAPRGFRLSNVTLAADDAPNGSGFFPIRWQVSDATYTAGVASEGGSDATVALYYDTDLNPASGRVLIASGINAASGLHYWNMAGLAPGVYHIYAVVTDAAGSSQGRYSTGPVRVSATIPAATDGNGNGLADAWETKYGVTNPTGDDDTDGASNLSEYRAGTHPRLSNTWTMPEGATGFFAERIALANPDSVAADVTLTFLRPSPSPPITRTYSLLPYGRTTVDVNGIAGLSQADVSTVITASTGGVVAERTMFWGDQYYGGHTGKAIERTGTTWYLAEGAANGFFATFILLANPGSAPATATVTFLMEPSGTFTRSYNVPANSRVTIYTNEVQDGSGARPLNGRSFSTQVTSTAPIAVERSMYFTNARVWNGGHEAAAVPAPRTNWYVAEGATGGFFTTFLLLANPNASPTTATIRYLLPGGQVVTRTHNLMAQSRTTVSVNGVVPNTEVSMDVSATLPIIVERAMYWPGNSWNEAHASAGIAATGTTWGLAEGELGGSRGFQTYVLIANPSASAASVRLRFMVENGTSFVTPAFNVPANSRVTRSASEFMAAGQLVNGSRFGVLVESLNGVPLAVEHAIYWNGGGEFWGGGSNEAGVRIR